jgi:hypothetical protein
MSHIPNSAMPHAAPNTTEQEEPSHRPLGDFAEMVRAHPKTAAAGAAALAGVVAAAAIPLVRARQKGTGGKSGATKKQKST